MRNITLERNEMHDLFPVFQITLHCISITIFDHTEFVQQPVGVSMKHRIYQPITYIFDKRPRFPIPSLCKLRLLEVSGSNYKWV